VTNKGFNPPQIIMKTKPTPAQTELIHTSANRVLKIRSDPPHHSTIPLSRVLQPQGEDPTEGNEQAVSHGRVAIPYQQREGDEVRTADLRRSPTRREDARGCLPETRWKAPSPPLAGTEGRGRRWALA
jgi:hypothetical protein